MVKQNALLDPKELNFSNKNSNISEAFLQRYKDFMPEYAPQQQLFAMDMVSMILNETNTKKMTVIPARCGISKSVFVQSLISFATRTNDYSPRYKESLGIIIVTDMLTRLEGYQAPPDHLNPPFQVGDYLRTYHDKYCTFITSNHKTKTAFELLLKSKYRPIVLLTTQRFFTMPDDQREMLYEYYTGKGKSRKTFRREIVIFDEKPIFYSTKRISAKNFDLCASALQEGIPKSEANNDDKDWILQEFWNYRNRMVSLLREKEKTKITKPTDRFYWRDSNTQNMTSNDERFFELIVPYRKSICTEYQDAFADLHDFKRIMKEGAFFFTTSKTRDGEQEYKTNFLLYQDNKDKFCIGEGKAKCFVFDATADIDPDYQLDYVEMMDCSRYNTNINMKINFIDVSTSKTQIVKGEHKQSNIAAITNSIKRLQNDDKNNALAISYKDISKNFQHANIVTGHFGGIKGLNDYRNSRKVYHIGLNRLQEFDYFIKYLSSHIEILEELMEMNENKSREYINKFTKTSKGVFTNDEMNNIMYRQLLTDFEQNIFRSKIRDYRNADRVEVYAFWNCTMFTGLNSMIRERYEPYGVEFENMGKLPEMEKMKAENRKAKDGQATDAQKLIEWHSRQRKGSLVKRSKLLAELCIGEKNFERLTKDNVAINKSFEKSGKKGYYLVL